MRSNPTRLQRLAIVAVGAALAGGLVLASFASGESAPPVSVGVPGQVTFDRTMVDQGSCAQTMRVNGVADVNGDGRPDILTAGESGVYWFDNPGLSCHVVAEGRYGEGATIFGLDVNRDGRLDIVTGDKLARGMVWFENRGDGSWVEHPLSPTAYCHNVSLADVNGDGRTDIGCADPDHATVSWLEAPADPTATWTQHVIDKNRPVWGAQFADIDRDGRVDLVSGRGWYRNTGTESWPRYAYTTRADTARPTDSWLGAHFSDYEYLTVLDLNHDGRLDIVATLFAGSPEGEMWAFLAPPDPTKTWTAVRLDPNLLFSVHSLDVGDFDGSGRPQILVGEMDWGGFGFGPNPDPKVLLYRLDGNPASSSGWTRLVLDHTGTHEARAVDFDGDGKLDFVGGDENSDIAGRPSGKLEIWRNTSPAVAPTSTTSTSSTTSTASTTTLATTTTATTTSTATTTTVPSAPSSAPGISFVGLSDGQTVSGSVYWEAAVAAGVSPVARVDFSIDGTIGWVERVAPYQWNADGKFDTTTLADGAHTLGLKVTRQDGSIAAAQIAVTVQNAPAPAQKPAPAPEPVRYVGSMSDSVYGAGDSAHYPVPGGDHQLLVFEFAGKLASDAVTSVTYAGQPLTRAVATGAGTARAELWYLVDPPAGIADVVWRKSGHAENCTWGVALYSGVDPNAPVVGVAQAAGSGVPTPLTIAADTGGAVVDVASFNGDRLAGSATGPAPDGGQTLAWSRHMSTTQGAAATADGAPSVTVRWTPLGDPPFDWALAAVGLRSG